MANTPDQFFLQAWKAQLDAGLRAFETLEEGAIRVYEAQLEAATQAHADTEATRKAIAAATDPSQVMKLCGEWASANVRRSLGCWRAFDLGTVDDTYQQWLRSVQQLYKVNA